MAKTFNKILPFAALAAAGYFIVNNIRDLADKIKISFLDVSFLNSESAKAGYSYLMFNVKLKISNTSDSALTLKELKGKFSSNGKVLAEVFKTDSLTIPPKKDIAGTVKIKVPALTLFQTLPEALKQIFKRIPITINIDGVAKFDAGTVNIKESKTVTW